MRRCRVPEDIATIVDDARVRTFVGRRAELACFSGALDGSTQRVLFVHGAGGLGKTALLHQFRILARTAGRAVASVDGEDVDGSPDGLQAAVRSARSVALGDAGETRPWVLLVDGYERLTAVDAWVRDRLVASLPGDVVVVLAGRDAPALTVADRPRVARGRRLPSAGSVGPAAEPAAARRTRASPRIAVGGSPTSVGGTR